MRVLLIRPLSMLFLAASSCHDAAAAATTASSSLDEQQTQQEAVGLHHQSPHKIPLPRNTIIESSQLDEEVDVNEEGARRHLLQQWTRTRLLKGKDRKSDHGSSSGVKTKHKKELTRGGGGGGESTARTRTSSEIDKPKTVKKEKNEPSRIVVSRVANVQTRGEQTRQSNSNNNNGEDNNNIMEALPTLLEGEDMMEVFNNDSDGDTMKVSSTSVTPPTATEDSTLGDEETHNGDGSHDVSSGVTFTSSSSTVQPTRPPSGVWETSDDCIPDGEDVYMDLYEGRYGPQVNTSVTDLCCSGECIDCACVSGTGMDEDGTQWFEGSCSGTCGVLETSDIMTTEATLLPFTTSTQSPPDVEEASTVCSCSPRTYTIKLTLTQLCNVDDLDTNDGIGNTLCITHVTDDDDDDEDDPRRQLLEVDDLFEETRKLGHHHHEKNHDKDSAPQETGATHISKHQLHKLSLLDVRKGTLMHNSNNDVISLRQQARQDVPADQLPKLQIVDVQFIEFATDAELTVLNQDHTYSDVSLYNGSILTFSSITNQLNPNESLSEQSELVPGGVRLAIRGVVDILKNGEVEKKIVNQNIVWSYTNDCQNLPVVDGDRIGWVTFESIQPASKDFCPVAPPPPPTAPPTTTKTPIPTTTTTKLPNTLSSSSSHPTTASNSSSLNAKAAKKGQHHDDAAKSAKTQQHDSAKSAKTTKAQKGDIMSFKTNSGKNAKQEHEKKDHMAKVHKKHHASKSKAGQLLSIPGSKSSKLSKLSKVHTEKGSQLSMSYAKSYKDKSPPSHKMEIVDAKAKKISSNTIAVMAKAQKGR